MDEQSIEFYEGVNTNLHELHCEPGLGGEDPTYHDTVIYHMLNDEVLLHGSGNW